MAYINIRIGEEAALKLRLLAKQRDTTIIDLIDQLLEKEERAAGSASPTEIQAIKKALDDIQRKTAASLSILESLRKA